MHDDPIDPFAGDPVDPSGEYDTGDDASPPLTADERQDVLEDLADLEIYQALLAPLGVRGLVIECEDCHQPHYFDWDLLRGNLRQLLALGRPRIHEPAYDPDPEHYVTWEYARGYADGVHDTLAEAADETVDVMDADDPDDTVDTLAGDDQEDADRDGSDDDDVDGPDAGGSTAR